MQTTQLNSMRPTQNTQLTQLNNATLLQHISQIPTSLDVFVSLAQVHCRIHGTIMGNPARKLCYGSLIVWVLF